MPQPRNPLTLGGAAFLVATALVSPALARHCQNLTIPVHITAANTDLGDDFATPQTDAEFTDFFLSSQQHGRQPPDTTDPPKTRNVTGDYELAATYCEPSSGSSGTPKVLQLLTHGIGFDRSYWDFAYRDYEYSYVNHALAHGYATLAWDRLGLGESTRLDPVREVQLPLEVEALRELTRLLRAGYVVVGDVTALHTDFFAPAPTTRTFWSRPTPPRSRRRWARSSPAATWPTPSST
ncbi:Alpha/Beta hydrolase protein [Apiospora marii]|uniref:Alpha/Beta hydrolase protein n=1 Tax=Apiospora marii TaxID=335849 RepID=A0ABR1S8C5_9PEZI